MALLPFHKMSSGSVRVTRIQLLLYCAVLALIIYVLRSQKGTSLRLHSEDRQASGVMEDQAVALQKQTTPWGAPIVWGDSHKSALRRKEFAHQGIRTGLVVLVVGTYARFARRFLSSAEMHFLPGQAVTYYILADNPRSLDPPIKLGPGRLMKVLPVTELPGWKQLAYRRMSLISEAIKQTISKDVEFLFCADVDQEFVAPVGEEIFGDLVATLHPELYEMPRSSFPYEAEEDSAAYVRDNEGDLYYTSEFYGGSVSEMFRLVRACAVLLLQDQANGVTARGLEESYLNRYLIHRRPTCVLSPEYNWWSSGLAVDVTVQRIISLGRQCAAFSEQKREQFNC
ncbi:globoside alpha-1,3-N-acetylgalactosaminyltransferase 1-like [Synchiropus picturatus]